MRRKHLFERPASFRVNDCEALELFCGGTLTAVSLINALIALTGDENHAAQNEATWLLLGELGQ